MNLRINMETDKEKIELRSEEVQEIIGQMPTRIERWGISIIGLLLLLALAVSFFIHYPETLSAEIVVTTDRPPVEVIVNSTGILEGVWVRNKQQVRKNEVLAIVEGNANGEDMRTFQFLFQKWNLRETDDERFYAAIKEKHWQLGDLQGEYTTLATALHNYLVQKKLNYYPQKLALKEKQMDWQQKMRLQHQKVEVLHQEEACVSSRIYMRDSILHSKRIMTDEDYDKARMGFLQSRQQMVADANERIRLESERLQEKEILLELRNEHGKSREQLAIELSKATEQMENALTSWRRKYVICSPIDGIVNLMSRWSKKQSVTTGDVFCILMPQEVNVSIGRAKVTSIGAGKIRNGQTVQVRLNNYPDEEFGVVTGVVSNISDVPDQDGNYYIEVSFPHGLMTNYGQTLPSSKQMMGTAQIVVEDQRLMERLLAPVKGLLER